MPDANEDETTSAKRQRVEEEEEAEAEPVAAANAAAKKEATAVAQEDVEKGASSSSSSSLEKTPREKTKPMRTRDLASVMLWYYKDKTGRRQGPFYPGQMRQWFLAGYFSPDQALAASFRGEVPRDFERLDTLFPPDAADATAFVARDGVALWPTAQPAPPRDADDDDDDDDDDYAREARERARREAQRRERPQWLEDSIQRQRAGIKRKMIYGPVERENYN